MFSRWRASCCRTHLEQAAEMGRRKYWMAPTSETWVDCDHPSMLHVTFHSFVDTCMPHGVVMGCEAQRQGVSFSRLCHARMLTSWWRVATPGETGRPRAAEWVEWGVRVEESLKSACRTVGPTREIYTLDAIVLVTRTSGYRSDPFK